MGRMGSAVFFPSGFHWGTDRGEASDEEGMDPACAVFSHFLIVCTAPSALPLF